MLRTYRADDLPQVHRLWKEAGWLDKGADDAVVRSFLEGCPGVVGEVHGTVEAHACRRAGVVRYERDVDLPVCNVASVVVGRVARGQGLGGMSTAALVAAGAAQGAALSTLGVFDQGFYDKVGFGTGPEVRYVTVDPATLRVPLLTRAPVRLGLEDGPRMHQNRLSRRRRHGMFNFPDPGATIAEMRLADDGFGIGFEDANGKLTHHFFCEAKGEHGPYTVQWFVHDTIDQLLELLAVIASWRDQVHGVRMPAPVGLVLNDVIDAPFRHWRVTEGGAFDRKPQSYAWWQARMCDVPACMAAARIDGPAIRFQLSLADPIAPYLPDDAPWRGVQGDYVVTLGPASRAERGRDASLPMLRASVGAFTRVWIGTAPASTVAAGDALDGDRDLLDELDHRWRVPVPHIDWDM